MVLGSVMFAVGRLLVIITCCWKVRSDNLKVLRDLILIVGWCLLIAGSIISIGSAIAEGKFSW